MEEYDMEDTEFSGNVPEFGAIFMANAETRKVCFKRKIFGLPFVQANFVKQVKAGMPLFLFEYVKRQMFGVYRASSDGAMNIMPHAFSSIGKQFPAQVCFTPIWICHPLSESEFKGAISENYYTPKKFKFGLSEEQVRRLLHLFSTRIQSTMLPSRQLIKEFNQSPKKVREQVGGDGLSANELSGMNHGGEDFGLSSMVDDEREGNFGQDFMADSSLLKNRRINSERTESDLYRNDHPLESRAERTETDLYRNDHLLESRAEIYLDNECIPPNTVTFSRGVNVFSSSDSAIAPNFSRDTSDLRKRAERHYCFDGNDRTAAEDGRSLRDDIMRSEVNLDPFLLDRRYGLNINDASYEEYLVREKEKIRNDKVLMNEKVLGLNHKDNYIRLKSLSENFGTPFDVDQRRNDEQRFSSMDNLIKAGYIDSLNRSTALILPSGIDTGLESHVGDGYRFNGQTSAINELDTENVTRVHQNALNYISSKCLNTPFPDVHYSSDCNRNYHTYDSVFDEGILRNVPDPASLHHGRSSPMVVGQNASFMRDTNNPYLSHSYYRASSKGKISETDPFGRSYLSDGGINIPGRIYSDYRDFAVTENLDSAGLRSASAAEYGGVQFSPSNNRFGLDFNPYSVSPKYLSCQMPEEILTSCGVRSPRANSTDWDFRNRENDAVNDEPAYYNNIYNPLMKQDNRGYNSPECGDSTGLEKPRKSVFARLTSSSSTIPKQAKDTDTDTYSPVNELMEILRQGEKFRAKKTKRKKPTIEQIGVEETKKKNAAAISLDSCSGKIDKMVIVPEMLIVEANETIDGVVHETLTETRAVEFRRRKENNRSTTCENKIHEGSDVKIEIDKSAGSDVKTEIDKSAENYEPKIQTEKQSKRRKLVRPVFAVNLNNKPIAPSEKTDNLVSCVNSAINAGDGDGDVVVSRA